MVGEGRTLKHVQVREYVRDACQGRGAGITGAVRARAGAPLRGRPDDGAPGDGRARRRGSARADPRAAARSSPTRAARSGRLIGYTEEMARRGLLAESQTLLARREQAGPGVARALSITEGDAVIHWKRLRRADGVPMCIEDAYLNEVLIPGFLQSGMPTSLYDALESRAACGRPGPRTPSPPTWPTPRRPGCSRSSPAPPCSVSRAARCAGDKVVEVSRSVYRADRFTMWVQLGQEALSSPQRRDRRAPTPRTPRPGPARRGRAGCAARARGASSQSRHTGHRPAALEQRVLHVLGDQPGDVRLALGPLLGPPLAVGSTASSRARPRRGGARLRAWRSASTASRASNSRAVSIDLHHARAPQASPTRRRRLRPTVGAWRRRSSR